MSARRFYVHDRGATVARELWSWTHLNPRFKVLDRTTGREVDEATSRYEARLAARHLNEREELAPRISGPAEDEEASR